MPIKRRTAIRTEKKHNLRHPLLKLGTSSAMIYQYIERNPGCTTREIRAIYPSGQPLTNLVDEGLVEKVGGHGKSRYWVIPENKTGQGRDLVEVEIVLFVNKYGEYSIRADMVNQHLTAHEDFPRELLIKTVKLRPPRPEEPYAKREAIDLNEMPENAMPAEANPIPHRGSLIIDAPSTRLRDKESSPKQLSHLKEL